VLAGSKNSPETDCLANQNDTKSSLSDFFTSTDGFGGDGGEQYQA
jgi:hypothetical protein